MYILYCDLCSQIIKPADQKFTFSILESREANLVQEEEEYSNNQAEYLQTLMRKIKKSKENVKTYEICKNCKKILDSFINLRIEEINKITKKLNTIKNKGANRNVKEKND